MTFNKTLGDYFNNIKKETKDILMLKRFIVTRRFVEMT